MAIHEKLVTRHPEESGVPKQSRQQSPGLGDRTTIAWPTEDAETVLRRSRDLFEQLHAEAPGIPIFRMTLAVCEDRPGPRLPETRTTSGGRTGLPTRGRACRSRCWLTTRPIRDVDRRWPMPDELGRVLTRHAAGRDEAIASLPASRGPARNAGRANSPMVTSIEALCCSACLLVRPDRNAEIERVARRGVTERGSFEISSRARVPRTCCDRALGSMRHDAADACLHSSTSTLARARGGVSRPVDIA